MIKRCRFTPRPGTGSETIHWAGSGDRKEPTEVTVYWYIGNEPEDVADFLFVKEIK